MADVFSDILNMSLTGTVVILFVLAARLVLKKVPKIFSYALWSVVLFRLLCPVSIPAPVSVLEVAGPEVTQSQGITSSVSYIPADYVRVEPAAAAAVTGTQSRQAAPQKSLSMMEVFSYVWLAGIAGMAAYSILTYVRLRRNLIGAVRCRGNVYLADRIASPFVLGVLRPKIYLPSDTPAGERRFIVAHERHHIHRCDHIIKLLAYAALCLHWFNPLVWLSFILAGKDMEMSCDEAVIKQLGPQIRADYSASLLRLATHRKIIAGTPLAFGEGDTKGRVMNMANWKKPKVWVSIVCIVLCVAVLMACALNPTEESGNGSYPRVVLDLPDGYAPVINMDGNTVFTNGEQVLGGVYRYEEPDVTLNAADAEAWLRAMGVPEITTGAYDYMCDSSIYSDLTATFSNPAGESWHEYFVYNSTVTDVWLDMDVANEEAKAAVLASVALEEPTGNGKHPVVNLELPADYTIETDADGNTVFTDGQQVIGGVLRYDRPDMELTISECDQWLTAIGVPEVVNGGYDRMCSTGSGTYSHMTATYANREGETRHEYYIWQDSVTDIWLDNSLNTGLQSDIWASVRYSDPLVAERDGAEASEEKTAEDIAFEKVKAVFDTVQSGSYQLYYEKINEGNQGPSGSVTTYCYDEGNWLSVSEMVLEETNQTEAGDYYNRQAYLCHEGFYYSNEGHWGERGAIRWEAWTGEEVWTPKLASFQWLESSVTYMDTLTDENGECLMFRIDKKYVDHESYTDHYFANFYFDPDGNFLSAKFQVNLFQDNAFTVTESIVSLDHETVAAQIEAEYNRATKSQ